MRRPRPGFVAWCGIAAAVVIYDALSPHGETLSESVDRSLAARPILTSAAVTITALHLLNRIPEKVDPFSLVLKALK
ncbi:DUF7427 family protein [Nocardia wallacei]|uniref:DUF7427 family protein n=1 Tax=Nocardia wallacei TaxID=480035 RepID=UPI00245463A8|nr:hypothetical protein [Nocardia wallacei]